ncbi:MAG TPA: hypothetical protein PLA64_04285 [Mesotoga infera]|jgi:ABC-2 type transport system ATP-binding protein|nr:hypothetical protein [Mesotoga infera]HON27499.1 hypothetical protein [Mesotoga infera]
MGELRDYVLQRNKTMIISSHEIYDLEEIAGSFAVVLEGKVLYSDSIETRRLTDNSQRAGHTGRRDNRSLWLRNACQKR